VEVSDEVAQDPAWFGPLYDDLEAGGTEEFLHLLLNLKLGTFHPRNVPKTAELAQQQYLSAPPIEQWLLACVESEYIVGHPGVKQLGQYVETSTLHEAFCKHTAQRGARAESQQMFGRLMTAMFGPSRRASVSNGQSRAMGYDLPDADGIRVAVDKRLGIGRR